MKCYCLIFVLFSSALAAKQVRQTTPDDIGDDYDDFASQPIKNSGANHNLKQVTYSTIQPKFDIPTTIPPTLKPQPVQAQQVRPAAVPQQQLRRGYYFQHYPWDRLPRQYLMRPGMTYVYPPQHQFANYQYRQLPSTYKDPYNIYKSHPGIGYGCGQAPGGCGGGYGGYGGYAQQYQGYASGGCGGGNGGCGGGDDEEYEDSEEYEDDDEEGGKSGETKINKKDPLEDLELEDLEKLSKGGSEDSNTAAVKETPKKSEDDEDLIDEDKKKRKKFLVKWAH